MTDTWWKASILHNSKNTRGFSQVFGIPATGLCEIIRGMNQLVVKSHPKCGC